MQARGSLQLCSSAIKNSTIQIDFPSQEEEEVVMQGLTKNKIDLLQAFKQSILAFEPPLSSQNSVQPLPYSDIQADCKQSQALQIQMSLPSVKTIPKQVPKAEQTMQQDKIGNEVAHISQAQKEEFFRRIQNATQFLVVGIQVDKYCFRWKKIEKSILLFSEDARFMAIYRVINGVFKTIDMKNFQGISIGTKTQRFKSYFDSGYKICEDNAFSIVFKNRSYDFTVNSSAIRDRIVRQLKFLWQQNKGNVWQQNKGNGK